MTAVAVGLIAAIMAIWGAVAIIEPGVRVHHDLAVGIDLPYAAPGVAAGTKVILHGAEVGRVDRLDTNDDGTVRIGLSLAADKVSGLTDDFALDFSPENYFGVTAVNLTDRHSGGPLFDGQVLRRIPLGDFTLSTMLDKGSLVVDGSLTDSMITTLDKVINYTDGLTPLIQTGVVFADEIARTQRAFPSVLLGYFDPILDWLPGFDQRFIDALYEIFRSKYNLRPDGSFGISEQFFAQSAAGLDLSAHQMFGAAGHLLASHPTELLPLIDAVTALSDAAPALTDNGRLTEKLRALIGRTDKAFSGPAGAKTLNLRVVVDGLPALAAPLGVVAPSGQLDRGHGDEPETRGGTDAGENHCRRRARAGAVRADHECHHQSCSGTDRDLHCGFHRCVGFARQCRRPDPRCAGGQGPGNHTRPRPR